VYSSNNQRGDFVDPTNVVLYTLNSVSNPVRVSNDGVFELDVDGRRVSIRVSSLVRVDTSPFVGLKLVEYYFGQRRFKVKRKDMSIIVSVDVDNHIVDIVSASITGQNTVRIRGFMTDVEISEFGEVEGVVDTVSRRIGEVCSWIRDVLGVVREFGDVLSVNVGERRIYIDTDIKDMYTTGAMVNTLTPINIIKTEEGTLITVDGNVSPQELKIVLSRAHKRRQTRSKTV
jgi:hypothetical protein